VPDNRVGHGPSIDAVRATRQCYPEESPSLTASYVPCPTDLAWAVDEPANLSCLRAQRFRQGHVFGRIYTRSPCAQPDRPRQAERPSANLTALVYFPPRIEPAIAVPPV